MTTYESNVKTISSNEEVVFGILSDLNNLKKYEALIPATDKIRDLQFDADSCSFVVDMFGKIGFRVVEREPNKTIKFVSENTPYEIFVWIQLKQLAENETKFKLTMKADLPTMIKMMVDKKLQEGVDSIAEAIAKALNSSIS